MENSISGERTDTIRSMLSSMGDGETGVSAYDTACVSLIKDGNKAGVDNFQLH